MDNDDAADDVEDDFNGNPIVGIDVAAVVTTDGVTMGGGGSDE